MRPQDASNTGEAKQRKQSGNKSDFNDVIQNFENMQNTSCYQEDPEDDEVLNAGVAKYESKYYEEPTFNVYHKAQKSKSLLLGKRRGNAHGTSKSQFVNNYSEPEEESQSIESESNDQYLP